jgi:cell division protein FtsL
MASWTHAQAVVAEPAARPRTRGGSRTRTRARARGGIVWIAVSGILLAGVVFVNVAVLRLNLALDGADSQRTQLLAQDAALQSQLSSELQSPRIESKALKQLGLQYQDPSEYGFVDLSK